MTMEIVATENDLDPKLFAFTYAQRVELRRVDENTWNLVVDGVLIRLHHSLTAGTVARVVNVARMTDGGE